MLKVNLKKIVTMFLSAVVVASAMCIPAFAEENTSLSIGDKVEYTYIIREEVDGEIIERESTVEEKIQMMNEKGRTPGTEFSIGNNKYIVDNDYGVLYNGKTNIANTNILRDAIARGNSIPTSKGSLPYTGTYSFTNYVYSNRYFIKGASGGASQAVEVEISSDNNQHLQVHLMDGRNNESMADSSVYFLSEGNIIAFNDWVYSGVKFYVKLTNSSGTQAMGSFVVR